MANVPSFAGLVVAAVVAADPAFADAPSPVVPVHIDSPRPVKLETRVPRWHPLCESPCDQRLPVDVEYRITGDGMRASDKFRPVARDGEEVVVSVAPGGTKGGHVAGLILTIVGGTMLGVAGMCTLVGFVAGAGEQGLILCGGIAGAGAGALIPGIVLMASNPATEATYGTRPARPAWETGLPAARTMPVADFTF
jgi:hypothetical protein